MTVDAYAAVATELATQHARHLDGVSEEDATVRLTQCHADVVDVSACRCRRRRSSSAFEGTLEHHFRGIDRRDHPACAEREDDVVRRLGGGCDVASARKQQRENEAQQA